MFGPYTEHSLAMPRHPRLELPGVPMHVTQRGVNRCAIFLDDYDRHHYRRLLRNACRQQEVAIHAFVLMDNHVHLLVGADEPGRISAAMRHTGQSYVQAFNQRHGRTGTLWQGRFKSSLVEAETHLLRVIRYIELNPVRAAMIDRPEAYRWSGVLTHLGLTQDPLVTLHPSYLALGANAYREWLQAALDADETDRIRLFLAQERALGHPRFQAMVERTLNRPANVATRGRPRRHADEGT